MAASQQRGWMGKILWVDLSAGTCTAEVIPEHIYEQYLSGVGLGAWLLYQRIPPMADPLGPHNVLAFVAGMLAGTGTLFSGRWMALAKSPLTGAWGEASGGGKLAPAIKACGYDGIFFSGESRQPVYLQVTDGRARLHPAGYLWGLDTIETEDRLLQQHGRSAAVACIGPAGEKRALIAGISHDGGRMAARGGLGAVMGAKKLKAIVLQGKGNAPPADARQIHRLNQSLSRWLECRPPLPPGKIARHFGTLMRLSPIQMAQDGLLYSWLLRKWGTGGMNQIGVEMGDAPVMNWRGSSADFGPARSAAFDPDAVISRQASKYHCSSCPLSCGGICRVEGVGEMHKPEYETMQAWGGLSLNADLDSVFRIHDLLNRAGMDAISAGATAAFAIECYQRGLLTGADTAGLELRWGDGPALLELARRMAAREGIGDLLADGSRKAALHLGGSAMGLAVHAGGQELAMHDSRGDPGFALHAVVEPAPGRHTTGSQLYYEMYRLWTRVPGLPRVARFFPKVAKYQRPEEKARMAAACSRFAQVMNSAGICLFAAFLGVDRLPIFEWLNAAAGWDRTPADYMLIGERIQTLRQAFNARQGIPLRHEINPRALGIPPQTSGANRGRSVDLDELVPLYWAQMGWDATSGEPTPVTMRRLGLEGLAITPQPASDRGTPPAAPNANEVAPLAPTGKGSMQQRGEINSGKDVHDRQAEQAQPDGNVHRVPDRQHAPRRG